MGWRKIVTLVASLMIALAPWLKTLESWESALSVGSIYVALPIVGGVLMAWMGSSPRFPTSYDGTKRF